MKLSDYTFEEIKAEYELRMKERRIAREEERAKAKRCRNCAHYGTVTAAGTPKEYNKLRNPWLSDFCPFKKLKNTSNVFRIQKMIPPSTKACEHFVNKNEEV